MIEIATHRIQPLEAGEEPGMPTYRINGAYDSTPFALDVSCEIDGRDVEFENREGNLDHDKQGEVFDALCETESWIKLHNEQCKAYYATF
jgi:hypothetical protein